MTDPPIAPAEKTEVVKVDASQANFACKDVRLKTWSAQRESIKNLLKLFQQTSAPEAGTKELSTFLRSKMIGDIILQELMPDSLEQISNEEMSLIITRSEALSLRALRDKTVTPPSVPLTGANGDSDSGKPVSEPSDEVMDTTEDYSTEHSSADISATQEPVTPPRSCNSRTPRRESTTKTVVRKPGYKSGHKKYSTPRSSSSKTDRSSDDRLPGSKSRHDDGPPHCSTLRGHSKRTDSSRRGAGK